MRMYCTCMRKRENLSDARKSGHHRRRTVGMVGNDPVMTLTPRIVDQYMPREMCVYVCMYMSGGASFSPPQDLLFLLPAGIPSARTPRPGLKVPMMHGETFVFAF